MQVGIPHQPRRLRPPILHLGTLQHKLDRLNVAVDHRCTLFFFHGPSTLIFPRRSFNPSTHSLNGSLRFRLVVLYFTRSWFHACFRRELIPTNSVAQKLHAKHTGDLFTEPHGNDQQPMKPRYAASSSTFLLCEHTLQSHPPCSSGLGKVPVESMCPVPSSFSSSIRSSHVSTVMR